MSNLKRLSNSIFIISSANGLSSFIFFLSNCLTIFNHQYFAFGCHHSERLSYPDGNLIQRNKELEQFTYIISHNLRAPVANIIGLYQMLTLGADDEQEYQKLISNLGSSVQKLDGVIMDLNMILDVKQQVHEQMEEVSFTQIAGDIKKTFDGYVQQGLIEIQCDFRAADTVHSLKNYLQHFL
ncbi:histidine kinase dimerization/phospho-acceptor domain-containing protein [Mucilaginibacter sp.]